MFGRNKIATLVAEFVGTAILTLVVLSVQRSTIGVPFFVALAAGLTVALMMLVVGKASGAHLNPAITIGLWTGRRISTINGVLYIIVQLLGAWAAYGLYTYFANSGSIQPIGGHYAGRVLIAEAVGTFVLAFAWAAAAYDKYNEGVRSALVGLGYILGVVVASTAAIGLINPAVALGVRGWVWGTYVLGPVLGGIIGVNLYGLLFAPAGASAATSASSMSVTTSSTSTGVVKSKSSKRKAKK